MVVDDILFLKQAKSKSFSWERDMLVPRRDMFSFCLVFVKHQTTDPQIPEKKKKKTYTTEV